MKQKETNKYVQDQIDLLEKHASVANKEMSEIKIDIAEVKVDVGWLKDTVKTHGTLLWSVLGGIILNLLVAIAFQLWK